MTKKFLRPIHTCLVLSAFVLPLVFPFVPAAAQNAPTPVNPSFTTQTKWTYGRFTKGLWLDAGLSLGTGAYTGSSISGLLNVPSTLGQTTTYTLPDPSASTANILLDQGVTSAVTIQHVAVPITSANILAMYATPVALIAAGAAGTNIVVHKVMFTMIPSGTAYASGGVVEFQISNTANGAGTATTATVAAAVVNASGTTTSYTTVIPVSYTGTAATGLFISNQTGAFTTGTGTAIVDIWYSIK